MYRCTVCEQHVSREEIQGHKSSHPGHAGYGIMWPVTTQEPCTTVSWSVPTLRAPSLAKRLGVRSVYVRDEGRAPSGSMKDYITQLAVSYAARSKSHAVTVTSSGNHAASLCYMTRAAEMKAVVFVTNS